MKKSRFAVQFILGLFLLALLAAGGCGGSDATIPIPGTYTISGTVTGDVSEGVAIYLSGSASATSTTTDEDGNYSFTVINGNYTVIPVLVGYTFNPVSTAVVVSGANRTGIDFVATTAGAATTYSLSGKVTGAVQAGVTITLSGDASATAFTLADGSYVFANLPAGSYTVTPSKTDPTPDYTFEPTSIDATIVDADITDQDFVATVTFAQTDLEGTWKVQVLYDFGALMRFTAVIDEDGFVTNPSTDCEQTSEGLCWEDGQLQWTIDSNGVISALLTGELSETYQARMTLGKNFVAGTDGDGTYSVMIIAQKVVPETVYSETDIQNKSLVLHQFLVVPDASSYWIHATGITDGTGGVFLSSIASPQFQFNDINPPFGPMITLILDPDTGIVTDGSSADLGFKGFLSADKKTIVATIKDTDDANPPHDEYNLIIIQITEPTFTIGPIPAGTYAGNVLGLGGSMGTPLWIRSLFTVDSLGSSSVIDWASSNALVTAARPGDHYIIFVNPSGTVKKTSDDTYYGQMSGDGMFIVGTQSNGLFNGGEMKLFYSLGIDIRTNGAAKVK